MPIINEYEVYETHWPKKREVGFLILCALVLIALCLLWLIVETIEEDFPFTTRVRR
jgi:hypothetical protein